MKFVLQIELGDDAMKGYGDIANALDAVSNELNTAYPLDGDAEQTCFQNIKDENGNIVGTWAVKPNTYFAELKRR